MHNPSRFWASSVPKLPSEWCRAAGSCTAVDPVNATRWVRNTLDHLPFKQWIVVISRVLIAILNQYISLYQPSVFVPASCRVCPRQPRKNHGPRNARRQTNAGQTLAPCLVLGWLILGDSFAVGNLPMIIRLNFGGIDKTLCSVTALAYENKHGKDQD